MADDAQIRIGLAIDTSGLDAGRSQAQAQADAIASAYDKVAAASLEVQNVQSRHKDILAQYQKGTIDAAESTKLLSENLRESAAAAASVAAAQKELSIAVGGTASAEGRLNVALAEQVSGSVAAKGAIHVLEGSMMGAGRAAAEMLSTTLGLGPVLASAFPLIGAAALAMVLVRMIEGIEKFAKDAEDLATELGTSWLQGAIGQMTGLADATKQADKEALKLAEDRDRMRGEIEQANIEHIRLTQGEAAAYAKEAADKRKQISDNEKILADLRAGQAELRKQAAPMSPEELAAMGAGGGIVAAGAEQARLTAAERLRTVTDQIGGIQKDNYKLQIEAANLDLEAAKKAEGKPKKENYTEEAAALRLQGATLGEIVLYWERINKDGAHASEVLRAQDEFLKSINEKSKMRTEKPLVESSTLGGRTMAGMAGTEETEAQATERINTAIEKQIALKQSLYELDLRAIEHQQKMGELTPRQAE
jgi:hypothetical protein